jgi:hypothetical protein
MEKDITKEVWKRLLGLNNSYEVSNFGNVRSYLKRNSHIDYENPKETKQSILKTHCKEYARVTLRVNGKSESFYTHRLVANYFIDNPDNKPQVNHIDNNPLNNNVNNLEWCNNSENQRHRFNSIKTNSLYIYFDKRYSKFRVQIKSKGINSGYFKTKEEAICYRDLILN